MPNATGSGHPSLQLMPILGTGEQDSLSFHCSNPRELMPCAKLSNLSDFVLIVQWLKEKPHEWNKQISKAVLFHTPDEEEAFPADPIEMHHVD